MFGQIIVFLLTILPDFSANVQLYQWPRFVGLKAGRSVVLSCRNYAGQPMTGVTWKRRAASHHSGSSGAATRLMESGTVSFGEGTGSLALRRLEPENSGVYYCHFNGTEGPGSEVQVHKQRNLEAAIRRSNMKDVVIFLQALLLGIFLLIPYLCYKDKKA
ncbi:immunoglobulin kappa variable 3-20 [Engraulis encrasicolus]|uniref:immunoglobulin kappa variable 3-20 n=1 Tax=Engraulis encrasicolus TaxID=184585 RepID=UPI002FD3DBE6